MKKDLREGLEPYLPGNSTDIVMDWLDSYPVVLKLSRSRTSKLGDYRPPVKDHYHRISINRDLHPYEFLLTLTHELAHLVVWENHGRRARPHGKLWKAQYAGMLDVLIGRNIFPAEVEEILKDYVYHPRANSKAHTDLVRVLHHYQPPQQGVFLEEIAENAHFSLPDGRRFIRQQKLRKWYRCQSLENRKSYRISPVTRVIPLDN